MVKKYIWNVLIGLDQFGNTLLGGDPDMTISGRMGRAIMEGKCKLCVPICWALHKLDKNHCANQAIAEKEEWDD